MPSNGSNVSGQTQFPVASSSLYRHDMIGLCNDTGKSVSDS